MTKKSKSKISRIAAGKRYAAIKGGPQQFRHNWVCDNCGFEVDVILDGDELSSWNHANYCWSSVKLTNPPAQLPSIGSLPYDTVVDAIEGNGYGNSIDQLANALGLTWTDLKGGEWE